MSDKPGYFAERFEAQTKRIMAIQEANDRAATWPQDNDRFPPWTSDRRLAARLADEHENPRSFPENEELRVAVCQRPDEDEPRRAYARWMERQPAIVVPASDEGPAFSRGDPRDIATFIDAQLEIAAGHRADPRFDPTPLLAKRFEGSLSDWRFGRGDWGWWDTAYLATQGVIDHRMFFRGFVEHVAIKAKYFLPFAEELYFLAPIRHLTLTYCAEHMDALAASPHLAQLRSISLPNRMFNNHFTRLNDLTDDHIRTFARSPHLAGLRHLDLEDAAALTPRALDHLAMAPGLASLSALTFDLHVYGRALGTLGDFTRVRSEQRVLAWRDDLEARHGYLPWLHPDEHYGTLNPDPEAPVEHPVGDATLRPDVAARRRPALPPALVDAIVDRLTPDGELRDRSLVVPLPTGRVVATLERATPDPALPDLRTLVTLTVQQTIAPIRAYDHGTRAVVELRPRVTATLGVPAPVAPT